MEIISCDAIVRLLRTSIPDLEWLLRELESAGGRVYFPPYLCRVIENLRIQNYPVLYRDERAIYGCMLRGFLTDEEIRKVCADIEAATSEQRGDELVEMVEGGREFAR